MTYAIYFELTDDEDSTTQGLFIPFFDLVGRSHYPTIWVRTVSTAQPSRAWFSATNKEWRPDYAFKEGSDKIAEITEHGMSQLGGISSHMKGLFSSTAFSLRGSFPIFLSNSMKLELLEKPTRLPVDLVTSIRLTRNLNQWPDLPSPLRVGVI